MNDPYRISETPRAAGPEEGSKGIVRPMLWLVLVISAAANGVTSTAGINPFIGIGFGLITLACAAGLIVQHYRNRR